MLELIGLDVVRVRSAPVWENVIDRLIARYSPKLAPDNIYVLTK